MSRTRKSICSECQNAWWVRYYRGAWVQNLRGCTLPKVRSFSKVSAFVCGKCKDFSPRCGKKKFREKIGNKYVVEDVLDIFLDG